MKVGLIGLGRRTWARRYEEAVVARRAGSDREVTWGYSLKLCKSSR